MLITTDLVMRWKPCPDYPRKRIKKIIGDWITPESVFDLDIPPRDKVWVLLHEEIIPERQLHELACIFAERALQRERAAGREPDQRSWAAIESKRKWLRGEITSDELAAARDAAWAAAWDASRDAAWDASRAAAWAAAWAAARDAAWAAAWDASRDAAGDAESIWQLEKIKEAICLK